MDAKRFTELKALDLKTIFHKELNIIYGKDEVSSFFFLCLEHFLNMPRIQLSLEPEFTISKASYNHFFSTLEGLKQQKPIQYILGETEFYGLNFKVNENVLIPRQETEELVDWILKSNTKKATLNILDIGTGSGCIAIALAKYFPKAAVYALDVSQEALKVAKSNAELNAVKITFISADVLNKNLIKTCFENLKFDIIVSNPPYVRHREKEEIKPNVLDYEPHLALFVKDENPLVFYKGITDFAVDNLKENGQLYFEINQYLGNETKGLLVEANFKKIELRKDLNGNYRMLGGIKK